MSRVCPECPAKESPRHGLIEIDDRPIRRDAFRAVEGLIKKIDRLDASIQAFQDQDQRLYRNWYELTFREERRQIEDAQSELQRLSKLHNWIIAEAEMNGLSIPQAYRILMAEEKRYAKGDERIRQEIRNRRDERDRFIASEIEREEREEQEARAKAEEHRRVFSKIDELTDDQMENSFVEPSGF